MTRGLERVAGVTSALPAVDFDPAAGVAVADPAEGSFTYRAYKHYSQLKGKIGYSY